MRSGGVALTVFELAAQGVDVALVCEDFDAAFDFYHRKLGLPIEYDRKIPARLAVGSGLAPSTFRHVRFRLGAALIKLMQISPIPEPAQAGFHAGVRWITVFVRDLELTFTTLSSRGVKFIGPLLEGEAGSFVCAEAPDALIIEFVQLYTSNNLIDGQVELS